MPKLKHFDDPKHAQTVLRWLREDLAAAKCEADIYRAAQFAIAALKKYNPSIPPVEAVESVGVERSLAEPIASPLRSVGQCTRVLRDDYWPRVRRDRDARPQRVYFAKSGDFVKTGCSRFVEERVHNLQMNSATIHELIGSIPGGFRLEKQWHQQWAHLRSHREWFHATPELMAAIHSAIAEAKQPEGAVA